ncbi:hypothetical protein Tco_0656685 [Tanacetum coccineum]|uniref:Uncharacterized protein n=1 Tax=Tanacetum coccineum TaxID=301880 RepID=A0ABQ4X9G0_9ASTR
MLGLKNGSNSTRYKYQILLRSLFTKSYGVALRSSSLNSETIGVEAEGWIRLESMAKLDWVSFTEWPVWDLVYPFEEETPLVISILD